MTKKHNRIQSIDLLKLIAMTLVIALHTCTDYTYISDTNPGTLIYRTGIVAVPTFFLITGYLLLGRENRPSDSVYALRKIGRILLLLIALSLAFAFFDSCNDIYYDKWSGFRVFAYRFITNLTGVCTTTGAIWMCWYLGALIIIYALYPMLNKIYRLRQGFFTGIMVVSGVCAIAAFCFNYWSSEPYDTSEMAIGLMERLWYWLFYFCLGGWLRLHPFRKISTPMVWVMLALFWLLDILQQTVMYHYNGITVCDYSYGSPATMALVATLFIAFSRLEIKGSRVLTLASSLFLPVYVLHIFVIDQLLVRTRLIYIIRDNLSIWVSPVLIILIVFVLTTLISLALTRIPYVRNIFKL